MHDNPAHRPDRLAARSFRLGMSATASHALTQTVDLLVTETLPRLGPKASLVLPILERIVAAQERGDGLAIADELEFELAPYLGPSSSP